MTDVMQTQAQDMPKSTDRKAASRRRILAAAGTLFCRDGIDAVGVDAVMEAAGLTHGGFYGHFPSKEALVSEVAAASLTQAAERWERLAAEQGPAAVETIVHGYLDPAHVAAAERGCVLTTIGPEMARRPEQRRVLSQAVRRMTTVLEQTLPTPDRPNALGALATLVGAVILARLAEEPSEAEAVLSAAEATVLKPRDRPSKKGDTGRAISLKVAAISPRTRRRRT